MKKAIFTTALLFSIIGIAFAQNGVKKRRPLPFEFGRVVINNYSEASNIAPVVFDHWLHRAKFTCRLCHVDIGFAMETGATDIKARDNINGYYCGTCHDGKRVFGGTLMFSSCKERFTQKDETCDRCHSSRKNVKKKYEFREFVKEKKKPKIAETAPEGLRQYTRSGGLSAPPKSIQDIRCRSPHYPTRWDAIMLNALYERDGRLICP